MKQIRISSGEVEVTAELNDTPTALKIWEALPVEGVANTWGDEVYFNIPVIADQEPGARAEVEVGELGYWPMGSAFCIFFGPTPVSTDDKPRAYSPVNVIGWIVDEVTVLKSVRDGDMVIVQRV
ncbi:MAG: cyclophilin-like fold protein [Chloroflexota bacterium]